MNLLGSFLLTATAVAPVLIAYAIVALIEQDILSCIVIISITIVLVILCFILLRLIRNKQAPFSLSITAVDSADRESLRSNGTLSYATYRIPVFRIRLENASSCYRVVSIIGRYGDELPFQSTFQLSWLAFLQSGHEGERKVSTYHEEASSQRE